jgi:colicin import membrane protein
MKGPSLQGTAAFSTALHLAFFLIAALILRQSQTVIIPSPYVVNLIGPSSSSSGNVSEDDVDNARPGTTMAESEKHPGNTRDAEAEQKRLEERLSALKAKKKVERIARLRSIVSVKRTAGRSARMPASRAAGAGSAQVTLFDTYYSKISGQIRQEWVYPDTGEKDLEAVISVRIAKDGTITLQGVEKSSGNALFDRSAVKALAKASPVAPPPYEMEIGMRFYP